jgi:hypothetical protein
MATGVYCITLYFGNVDVWIKVVDTKVQARPRTWMAEMTWVEAGGVQVFQVSSKMKTSTFDATGA